MNELFILVLGFAVNDLVLVGIQGPAERGMAVHRISPEAAVPRTVGRVST